MCNCCQFPFFVLSVKKMKLDVVDNIIFSFSGHETARKNVPQLCSLEVWKQPLYFVRKKAADTTFAQVFIATWWRSTLSFCDIFLLQRPWKTGETYMIWGEGIFPVIFPWFTTRKTIETCQKQYKLTQNLHGLKYNWYNRKFYQYSLIFKAFMSVNVHVLIPLEHSVLSLVSKVYFSHR